MYRVSTPLEFLTDISIIPLISTDDNLIFELMSIIAVSIFFDSFNGFIDLPPRAIVEKVFMPLLIFQHQC